MTQQTGAPPAEVIEPEQTDEQLIEAERRVPDVAQYAGGVSSDSQHTALRASVRQLGQLLGEALTRHEGPELLAKVETIRRLSREHRDDELHAELDGVDDATAVRLARAFTAYFQLVNVTEQLHRWQELANVEVGPLTATARRIGAALEKGTVDRRAGQRRARLGWSTGRSSPPTPRRRAVVRCWSCCARSPTSWPPWRTRAAHPRRRPQHERRLAELVDLLWQTDELRVVRPEPKDEARTATYYLQSIAGQVVPDLLAELDRALASIGIELPRGRAAAAVRQLGRRRPRRQPERHAAGHPRRARAAARRSACAP